MNKPVFSILHTSARPHAWRAIYDDWMSKAWHPETVEYVLVIDSRWGFSTDPQAWRPEVLGLPFDNLVVVENTGRRCYVEGVNLAARAAGGSIFVVNADDQFACERWDSSLSDAFVLSLFPKVEDCINPRGWIDEKAFVIEVSTGTPDEHNRGILVMPILSRARYEAQGSVVFYPEYESMFADNDFCAWARLDGVVIDARELMFPHRHPMFDGLGGWKREDWKKILDPAYLEQNRSAAYAIGERVFKARQAAGFKTGKRRSIFLALTGEKFEGAWVDGILDLYSHLVDLDFAILRPPLSYTTNVFETRESLRRTIVAMDQKPELILLLDDDNILSPAHFDVLLAGLDRRPNLDGMGGWCWIHRKDKTGFHVSCGEWAPNRLQWDPFPATFSRERAPRPFEVGGLPCMLLRYSAFEKAGDGAFLPVLSNEFEYGMAGEDISFFMRAGDGGAVFWVDPRVRVPHLKYVDVEPILPEEGAALPAVVACMIRAKNEGRWIARTIASVKALCGENIFVLEDGSTDDTCEVARAAGAHVIHSPFAGLDLDECRDKDWLLDHVKGLCSPDWILMPDGDEELEPGGCDKIRRVVDSNPPVDIFSLRFLYLWDSIEQYRSDGVYGSMGRQSLFRANSDLKFRSYYEKEGENHNHVGLHCSNAPGLGAAGIEVRALNVYLLHYGYLHRADRIRKYRWLLSIDPHNEQEDYYRHTVQGDIPEVPAGDKLKIAGPLELRQLRARLVPRFAGEVPGPVAAVESFAAG